ncbi:response regulator [Joostella atrarenae]|uniref:Response regulator n=1 Tax=Joostella atrarenae TaxID=679257 RepID=A0ABS9J7P0_9FLAO|nr:response regulator [Joostella atrarenae]MCF8716448.1 response regulator [Joostella atrarenae]
MNKILLIEDDKMLRENTVELLKLSKKYKVFSADNGLSGIEMAKEIQPDIILCDIMMNPIDGYKVYNELKSDLKTSQIPFVFISAKGEYKDIRFGMNLGADDYLTKPYTEEDLNEAIDQRLKKVKRIKKDLKRNQFLRKNIDTIDLFKKNAHLKVFKKDSVVYDDLTNTNNLYLIKSGLIKSYQLDTTGKILGLYLFKSNDYIGNFSMNNKTKSIGGNKSVCIQDTVVYCLSTQKLSELIDSSPSIGKAIIDFLTRYIYNIQNQFLPIIYGNSRSKTLTTLHRLKKILTDENTKFIDLPRHDIANFAGMSTETLIRTLKILEKERVITLDKKKIYINELLSD